MLESIIVVGAGGDIGAACARSVARKGDLVVCVDRDGAALVRTVRQFNDEGISAVAVVADATDADFASIVSAPVSAHVRSLIYAVAFEEHEPASSISVESVRRSFETGPLAAFGLAQYLFTAGLLGAGSSITMIGSLHAKHAFSRTLGYNLAQAGTASLVQTLAHEWAPHGVRVNEVVPGWTQTSGEVQLYGEEQLKRRQSQLPMGRAGAVDDIAKAVAFLASSDADYVSGARLAVDGALGASLATLPGEAI
ncbi:SDR family oxidoreductase [Microbacterium sp. NC79]|uniref:SDR family NAD(P)-dependent oxidoreductase n=1 Tax=Microbacterium sp. NC79 TaxID=2851009 RepID=UPI001C2C3899|nr:SDR family oxidoreductase [Microbacterium sp. NC79]